MVTSTLTTARQNEFKQAESLLWTAVKDASPVSRDNVEVQQAATTVLPMPDTVAGAWAEFSFITEQGNVAGELCEGMEARRDALEALLYTLPAKSAKDVLARLEFLRTATSDTWPTPQESLSRLIDRVAADVRRML